MLDILAGLLSAVVGFASANPLIVGLVGLAILLWPDSDGDAVGSLLGRLSVPDVRSKSGTLGLVALAAVAAVVFIGPALGGLLGQLLAPVEAVVGLALAHPVVTLLVAAALLAARGADAGVRDVAGHAERGLGRVTAQPGGEAFLGGVIVGFALGFGGATPVGIVEGLFGLLAGVLP